MIDFSKKVTIFKEPSLAEEFKTKGFVIVPFLSSEQIQELTLLYQKLYPEGVKGFFPTTFAQNPAHRAEVNRSIKAICTARMNQLFEDYKVFFSSFIVKAPGKKSELVLHQDMTLVNEKIFTGMNIWCPLIDLEGNNGVLNVLPESHRLFFTYHGSSLPDIYDYVKSEIKQYLTAVPLKAGQAIIFDQSIIHYSPPNLSDKELVVINTFVAHKEAEIRICYHDKENQADKVEVFAQADDFLEEYLNFGANIFDRPSIGKSLGFVDYDFPMITEKQLDDKYGKKPSFFNRLKTLWE